MPGASGTPRRLGVGVLGADEPVAATQRSRLACCSMICSASSSYRLPAASRPGAASAVSATGATGTADAANAAGATGAAGGRGGLQRGEAPPPAAGRGGGVGAGGPHGGGVGARRRVAAPGGP